MTPFSALSVAIVFQSLGAHGWLFTSMGSGNNRIDVLELDEDGVYPVPYEKPDRIEIDEEHPPDPPKERISMSFPGTRWCGPGNTAFNYHDLGIKNETDKCCREHDFCDDIIPAGHTAHGLVNDDFYSKLNCRCDEIFYDCLKKAEDEINEIIGGLYFNAIGTKCFRLDYPIVRCLKYRGVFRKKCLEYEFDTTKEKLYQWFDVPPFK